jgi:hypothetical protein
MLDKEYDQQAGLDESVVVLAQCYFEYMAVFSLYSRANEDLDKGDESKKVLVQAMQLRLHELNIFIDNGENIELRHEWANLSQEEANLVVGTLSETYQRIKKHIDDVRPSPQLKLSGEGELPDPSKPLEPNPNLTLRR